MTVRRSNKKGAAVLLSLTLVLCMAACVNNSPAKDVSVTPEPTAVLSTEASITQEPTAEPEASSEPALTEAPSDTEAPSAPPASKEDLLGNTISGADHFKRYIVFENVIVYDEEGDTFVDAIAVNRYPEPITCAVDIVYYGAEGEELARARLRMRDGSYLLTLAPGDNYVLANILTDMTLTGREFVLEYDIDTPVLPATETGDE